MKNLCLKKPYREFTDAEKKQVIFNIISQNIFFSNTKPNRIKICFLKIFLFFKTKRKYWWQTKNFGNKFYTTLIKPQKNDIQKTLKYYYDLNEEIKKFYGFCDDCNSISSELAKQHIISNFKKKEKMDNFYVFGSFLLFIVATIIIIIPFI